jgi:geranylgeranyl pyrophosphate synthase
MVNNLLTTAPFYTPVQNGIRQVEERMYSVTNGHHPDLKSALDHIISSGGKRIRPAVTLLTGDMLGADRDKLISLAAAIELLHTATLIHDDLIDGALLRRGNPTLNAQWTPGATVLTGDFVFACAAVLASETDEVELMRSFAETLSTIVNGEITQMFSKHGEDLHKEYYERIYAKTASLFVLATTAPSLLSPIQEETYDAAQRFGYGIGMAFQIIDDVLDFTGDQVAVGKPVANDLRQGLITLPTIHYYKLHPEDLDLALVLRGEVINNERFDHLITQIQSCGAIEKSVQEADRFVAQGLDALQELPMTPENVALEDLANYILDRHR